MNVDLILLAGAGDFCGEDVMATIEMLILFVLFVFFFIVGFWIGVLYGKDVFKQ